MHPSDPNSWHLEDLDPIRKSERKHYAEAARMVPFGLNLLAVDGSGHQVVGLVGAQFALSGAVVHVDLDDMAARIIASDTDSFLTAARALKDPRQYWHWLNEMIATDLQAWQPGYRSIEFAVGLSRHRGITSSLLFSLRRQISRSLVVASLGSPIQEIAERALEEAVRRRVPGLDTAIEKFSNDPRRNIASAARRYLREANESKSN